MGCDIPDTRVLAIASHVAHGYVGNVMATFILQALGCEVSAINTVQYSNHTGYKQRTGYKTTDEQILELYDGLKKSFLNDFDILLSGYIPSAEAVQAVGKIGRELKDQARTKPGSFFWALDPVMGDDGRLYIPEDEVPAYKSLLRSADLILPNQFEAELLSDTKITNLSDIATTIGSLHRTYQIPHIIITSLRLSQNSDVEKTLPATSTTPESAHETLTIVGSTCRADFSPRIFRIDVPALPLFFAGTGDMFAALTIARLREAVIATGVQNTARWISPDEVSATELPLATAAQKVLASMQAVLDKTYEFFKEKVPEIEAAEGKEGPTSGNKALANGELKRHLRRTKASEVRVVQNAGLLLDPPDLGSYEIKAVENAEASKPREGEREKDELGVTDLGLKGDPGAVQVD